MREIWEKSKIRTPIDLQKQGCVMMVCQLPILLRLSLDTPPLISHTCTRSLRSPPATVFKPQVHSHTARLWQFQAWYPNSPCSGFPATLTFSLLPLVIRLHGPLTTPRHSLLGQLTVLPSPTSLSLGSLLSGQLRSPLSSTMRAEIQGPGLAG